jgi:hypothetical protein
MRFRRSNIDGHTDRRQGPLYPKSHLASEFDGRHTFNKALLNQQAPCTAPTSFIRETAR